MRSIGYDTLGFALQLSWKQWQSLSKLCNYTNRDGAVAFLPDKVYFQWKKSFVLCTVNVATLLWDRNVWLAGPEDLETAFERLDNILPPFVSLRNARILSVHFTYTQDTPSPFREWKGDFAAPKRGHWQFMEEEHGLYFNGSNSRFVVYSKDEHLKAKGKPLPKCEFEHLIRPELRMDTAVLSQLKSRGLWSHNSIIGSDLSTPEGFLAFVRFFEWRVPQFIVKPGPGKEAPLSGMARCILSDRMKTLRYFRRRLKSGSLPDQDYFAMLDELGAIENRERPKSLLEGIHAECSVMYERYEKASPLRGAVELETVATYAWSELQP